MCYMNNLKLVAIETIGFYCHLFSNADVPRTCTILVFVCLFFLSWPALYAYNVKLYCTLFCMENQENATYNRAKDVQTAEC